MGDAGCHKAHVYINLLTQRQTRTLESWAAPRLEGIVSALFNSCLHLFVLIPGMHSHHVYTTPPSMCIPTLFHVHPHPSMCTPNLLVILMPSAAQLALNSCPLKEVSFIYSRSKISRYNLQSQPDMNMLTTWFMRSMEMFLIGNNFA